MEFETLQKLSMDRLNRGIINKKPDISELYFT